MREVPIPLIALAQLLQATSWPFVAALWPSMAILYCSCIMAISCYIVQLLPCISSNGHLIYCHEAIRSHVRNPYGHL